MSIYDPWKGTMPDGTEVLVTIQRWRDHDGMSGNESVELAFRPVGARTWGPPVSLTRAP